MTGGEESVNTGATGAGVTAIVRCGLLTALVALLAEIVKLKAPATVGVPDRTPVVACKLRPVGRAPEATENVGAG